MAKKSTGKSAKAKMKDLKPAKDPKGGRLRLK